METPFHIILKSVYLENGSKTGKSCLEQEMKRESMGSEIINAKSQNNSTYICANLPNKQTLV